MIKDKPSIFMNLGYTRDRAALEHLPAAPLECAALAKALVDYGEAVEWERKANSFTRYWTCTPLGTPSGPPLIGDLVEIAKQALVGHPTRSWLLSGAALVATELLQMKGLVYSPDIMSWTPAQAGGGLWSYLDLPLVKYARAGCTAMVVAMLEAGAAVDQSLLWLESLWDYDKCYHWRGDSVLMAAAREGHTAACALLLHYGASRSYVCCYDEDCYDEGPAAAARRSQHPEVAALIEGYQQGQLLDPALSALIAETRRALQGVVQGTVEHSALRIIVGQ